MKKFWFMLIVLCVVSTTSTFAQRYASSGLRTSSILVKTTPLYLGSAEVSASFGGHHGGFQVLTSHGVQFNRHFYLGAGTGLIALFPYKKDYDYEEGMKSVNLGDRSILCPLFVNFRPTFYTSLPMYLDLKIGGAFGEAIGAYLDLSYGFTVVKTNDFNMNVFVGYQLAPAESKTLYFERDIYGQRVPSKDYSYSNSIRLGISFFFGKGVTKLN